MFDNIIDLGDGHKIESGKMFNEETGLLIDPRSVSSSRVDLLGKTPYHTHAMAMLEVFNLIRHTFYWGINPLPVLRRKLPMFDWRFVSHFSASGGPEMDWKTVRRRIRGTDLVWCADASGVITATRKAGGGGCKPLVATYKDYPFFQLHLAQVSTLSVEVTPGKAVCVLE